MNKILQILVLVTTSLTLSAQSSVTLQLNHLLDGEQFEREVNSLNNLDNDFMIERLEYYLSGFSIVHDGGQVTPIEDLYVLVSLQNRTDPTEINLGSFDIESLEAVRFHFGVDEEANHSDPALYPSNHALAPKFPSMHWGWAAGYRFIALEGKSGPNVDQTMEFHYIGDEFYSELEFPASLSGLDSYVVEVDAEYTKLLSDIDISSGIILHGNLDEIQILASNITDNVFTAKNTTSIQDHESISAFNVYPNPSTSGILNVDLTSETKNTSIIVFDVLGKQVFNNPANTTAQITLNNKGMYYVVVSDNQGNVLATRKIIHQ